MMVPVADAQRQRQRQRQRPVACCGKRGRRALAWKSLAPNAHQVTAAASRNAQSGETDMALPDPVGNEPAMVVRLDRKLSQAGFEA